MKNIEPPTVWRGPIVCSKTKYRGPSAGDHGHAHCLGKTKLVQSAKGHVARGRALVVTPAYPGWRAILASVILQVTTASGQGRRADIVGDRHACIANEGSYCGEDVVGALFDFRDEVVYLKLIH